jgi:CubicO group peptidase (beta-lactamase class C family)
MFGTVLPMSQGGYWLYDPAVPSNCPARGARTISVPGHGGSLAWGDPDTGLAVAFCHNRMSNNMTCEGHPAWDVANAVRESLGLEAKEPA